MFCRCCLLEADPELRAEFDEVPEDVSVAVDAGWMTSRRLPEAEDRQQGVVDSPELLATDVACQVTQPSHIHGTDLFDEHAGHLAGDVDLWPERRRASAARCRSDQNDRAGKQLVGLDDHAVSISVLLVANAAGKREPVHVTSEHAMPP